MLWTVFADEVLFGRDDAPLDRELAMRRSILDRRESLTALELGRVAPRRVATWPRPIGVRLDTAESEMVAYAV